MYKQNHGPGRGAGIWLVQAFPNWITTRFDRNPACHSGSPCIDTGAAGPRRRRAFPRWNVGHRMAYSLRRLARGGPAAALRVGLSQMHCVPRAPTHTFGARMAARARCLACKRELQRIKHDSSWKREHRHVVASPARRAPSRRHLPGEQGHFRQWRGYCDCPSTAPPAAPGQPRAFPAWSGWV